VRPLLSGKEAEVFLVTVGGELRVAKVYKEAHARSFKNRAEYTEGRKVRNSRDQRAMQKRSRYGRAQDEQSWRSTEVDMILRLHAAGVRVPTPYVFIDGVLVMELIADAHGNPAPRLAEVSFDRDQATCSWRPMGPCSSTSRSRWTPPATRTRASCCCATSATSSASSRASCPGRGRAPSPKRCGICTRAACSHPKRG
jgi:hypothetical protein